MKDYNELIRKSIRKDFNKANFKRNGRVPKIPHPTNTKRIISVAGEYYRYRKYLIGKLVRFVKIGYGNNAWYEFVNEDDRIAINNAAGWSNNKRIYLLDNVKFDD